MAGNNAAAGQLTGRALPTVKSVCQTSLCLDLICRPRMRMIAKAHILFTVYPNVLYVRKRAKHIRTGQLQILWHQNIDRDRAEIALCIRGGQALQHIGGFDINILQIFAIAQRFFPDFLNTCRQAQGGQRMTVLKCGGINDGNALGNDDLLQRRTVPENALSNSGHPIRDMNLTEQITGFKCLLSDNRDAVGNYDLFQRVAESKGIGFNRGHGVGQHNGFQI